MLASTAFSDPMENMSNANIEALIIAFEDASKTEDGVEFWYAKDLQKLFDYEHWEQFSKVVEKAKSACEASGHRVASHFRDVTKVIEASSEELHDVTDIQLTRYASYLVAQNGDSVKKPVAFAQTYFAIQTRRQEIRDSDHANRVPLSEDKKRLLLREEIKEHNKRLAIAAKRAGVVDPVDFAVFQNFGYRGLYGGLDSSGIRMKKGLRAKSQILDYMGSTELAANLFRATQAEEMLKRAGVRSKQNANQAHFEVGQKVREVIKDIGGTMPEDLPPAEDIAKVGRRMQKAITGSQKKALGGDAEKE